MNKKYAGNITRSLPHTPLLMPSWNDSPSKESAPKPLMPTPVRLRTSSTTSLGKIPASCLRQTKRLPWVPSDEVWADFVRHVLQDEDARTRAMILLAYDGALRREELMSLRVDDIDWARGLVTIRPETTKGGRMRYVPVSEA